MQADKPLYRLLREAYVAFNARNIDAALSMMRHDVAWPNGMEGAYVRGHAQVRAYWTRQWTTIDPHVEPLSFHTEPDGRIAVSVHQVVRDLAGALLQDRQVEHVFRLRDGLVAEMEIRA